VEVTLKVRFLKFDNGERFPQLIRNIDGQPLFSPTVYATSILRGRCSASKTIEYHLRSIMHLYTWAAGRQIDIDQRMRTGNYLTLVEVVSLVQAARLPYKNLLAERVEEVKATGSLKLRSLERYRATAPIEKINQVDNATVATRIAYMLEYLDWLTLLHLSNVTPLERAKYDVARKQMLTQLDARKPSVSQRSGTRMGLTKEIQTKLINCLRPAASDNPWHDPGIQIRNELLVAMLMSLGIRRGEELGITIDRIDLRKNEVRIIRNADDPGDPRTYEPNTKTKDRDLPLEPGLAEMIMHYVSTVRSKVPGARKHKFLFVAHDTGRPMSFSAFTKVFSSLRSRVPGLPKDLSAHILRHTWNDRFSELMDEKGAAEPDDEIKLRSYLMGWSETSGTASVYTRRWTKKKAQETSLKLQRRLAVKEHKDGDGPQK